MADVTIDAGLYAGTEQMAARGGVFWTSPLIGYVIYVDASIDLKYRKTTDGGANWSEVNLLTGNILAFDSWADWQTPGDAGTVIHIACIDADTDDVLYFYIDTNDDSTGSDKIEDCQGTGAFDTGVLRVRHGISITKAKGGNLAVSFYYTDSDSVLFYGFYTSPDADTWTSKTNPREINLDHLLLFPGNEADNQDVWAVYWDISINVVSLKTFDDSGNSWSEQAITAAIGSATYLQMDGAIRFSDGHLLLAVWSQYNTAVADLEVWDINGAASLTAKTDIITDTAEYALASVFINQANDDIYVAYAGGTDFTSLVKVFYKKSDDGGGTWGGETAMQADAEDDERWISCGAMKKAWGGMFLPVWHNDDLYDLFCNTDNGISIAAPITITTSSSLALTSTLSRGLTLDRGVSSNISLAASLLRAWTHSAATSAGLTLTTSLSKSWGTIQTTTSNLSLTTTVSRALAMARAVAPSINLTASISKSWNKIQTTVSSLSLTTTVSKSWGVLATISASLSLTTTVSRVVTFARAVAVALGLTPQVTYTPTAITQTVTIIGSSSATLEGKITEDAGGNCEARFRYRVKVGEGGTLDLQVTTSLDDYDTLINSGFQAASLVLVAGNYNAGSKGWRAGMVFRTVNIPQGSTITVAYLTFRSYSTLATTVVRADLCCEDEDSATRCTDALDFVGRSRTTPVAWDLGVGWTANTDYQSPSIVAPIQSIINRVGWAANNDLQIFWEDKDEESDEGAYRQAYAYDASATYAPKLHIEWVEA